MKIDPGVVRIELIHRVPPHLGNESVAEVKDQR